MPPSYLIAREHLQRAAAILQGGDSRSRQLRYIIERTITLMDEAPQEKPVTPGNVLDLAAFRDRQLGCD
ncbi:hypothetical protein SAMN05428969_1472 [Devosia sp. YR412]|uniref:hypothetical protein n=1 Tax=Devosia sp. YR412 TaxID=1881030 RepID=UPI0008BFA8F4|nr:hypothetical protein [Devosia sp. YR412]SEP99835.1 hypothetical protein SAMN05428969_1472 [Devosia sp. YR412]